MALPQPTPDWQFEKSTLTCYNLKRMAENDPTLSFDSSELTSFRGEPNLSYVGCMEHVVDTRTGLHYLRLADETVNPYPTPTPDQMLDDLLLPRETDQEGVSYLCVPEGSMTLIQALDAVVERHGHGEDVISTIAEGVISEEAQALFTQLGDQLSVLAEGDEIIPEKLVAKQVLIIPTDEDGGLAVKLLPPLWLQETEGNPSAATTQRDTLLMQVYNSALHADFKNRATAGTIPAAFKGFTDAFTFGKQARPYPFSPSSPQTSHSDDIDSRAS